ncbi:MAG: hypothetical protein ABI617_07595 [Sphingomicrobium sp.]
MASRASTDTPHEDYRDVELLLRMADRETVAALRAIDERAVDSHSELARYYSVESRRLMSKLDQDRRPTATS